MTFGEAIKTCFRKYVTVAGRASRSEYWWFFLFSVLVQAGGAVVSETIAGLLAVALLLPSVAVGARRLHDIGKSSWWLLIGLIPVIGALILLYWFVQPSAQQANEYGEVSANAPA
jgi:uncharacterized membrane protein YhaH (DUF805 family)